MNKVEQAAYTKYQQGICPYCEKQTTFEEYENGDSVLAACNACHATFTVYHILKKVMKGRAFG